MGVATEDEPYEASIYCQTKLHTTLQLDGPKGDLVYTVTGVPFKDETDAPPTPRPVTTASPTNAPTGDFTVHPNKACKANKNLGTSFSFPLECAEAAKNNPSCTGTEIMWSEKNNLSWGCRCCYEHPTCPADSSRYKTNSNWDVYEYEKCGGDVDTPTNSPTLTPTDAPTPIPTATPTTLQPVDNPTAGILTKYPNLACINKKNIGTSFLSPEECAEAAKINPSCTGREIMWSEKNNLSRGCKCCYEHPTCPADSSRYKPSNNWDVYEYDKCDGEDGVTNTPTYSPSSVASNPPSAPRMCSIKDEFCAKNSDCCERKCSKKKKKCRE